MGSPSLFLRKFTFTHEPEPSDADPSVAVPVMDVTVQVLSFGRRGFWVHVAESRAAETAPPALFGPSAVALCGVARDPSAALLADEPSPQHAGAMAQQLAQRLARRLQRECGEAVAVYVSCGFAGEKAAMLLGQPTDSSFDAAKRFGATVFANVLGLIREEILVNSHA